MKVTILPGVDKLGNKENFSEISLVAGDTLSIVGNTGSGKSALINDIEVLAQGDTVTKRRILIDDQEPSEDMVRDPSHKPIALITQNTRVIADLTVQDFINLHIEARKTTLSHIDVVFLANEFTGEKITSKSRIASLSGGQTKALLIADAILVGQTPILLLDEVENAGIYKDRFIDYLKEYHKTVIFVTHNPLLSLITDRRIVMKNGAVSKVITPDGSEQSEIDNLKRIDSYLMNCRESIRKGELLCDYL